MTSPIMLAHIGPHFQGAGLGLILIVLALIVAGTLLLASGMNEKEK
jgi:hypothetical protein